jgi:hypothetical protein
MKRILLLLFLFLLYEGSFAQLGLYQSDKEMLIAKKVKTIVTWYYTEEDTSGSKGPHAA